MFEKTRATREKLSGLTKHANNPANNYTQTFSAVKYQAPGTK